MNNVKTIIGGASFMTVVMTLLTSYAYKKGKEDGMIVGGATLASMAFNSLNEQKKEKSPC